MDNIQFNASNIVNQLLDEAVECGAYQLVDMGARQTLNDVADKFTAQFLTLMSKKQVAAYVHLDPRTLNRYMASGLLQYQLVGMQAVFTLADVLRFQRAYNDL